tara:strand:+ start:464 stop:874 length:411 start_codon:yes stop_codon:yes gene_type:complete
MVDPDVKDWERLRKAIPAIEVPELSIDHQMKAYVDITEEEFDEEEKEISKEELEAYIFDEEDVVNSPSHYNSGSIECIEAIQESMSSSAFKGYLKGNVQKYLWRYEMKGKPVEDLQKAQWYLAELIKELLFEEGED